MYVFDDTYVFLSVYFKGCEKNSVLRKAIKFLK